MAKEDRYLLNKVTGVVWPWTPMMVGIPNKAGLVFQRQVGDQLQPGHPDMVEITKEEAMAILNKVKAQPEVIELPPKEEVPELSADDLARIAAERTDKIEEAIANLPEDKWGKGPTPYPITSEVSAITGFQVTFQEIKAIVTAMREQNDSSRIGKENTE